MKNIKPYKLFLESDRNTSAISIDYSIYDFFQELKEYLYSDNPIDMNRIKKWSDHFIGDGVYEKVLERTNKIFGALDMVDMGTIKDRLYDVFDEYPYKNNYVMLCVMYGEADRNIDDIQRKYNGSISISDTNSERRKNEISIYILKAIISPTLRYAYPSKDLRTSDEEVFVTDKKYQCINFDFTNYTTDLYNKTKDFTHYTNTIRFESILKNYNIDKIIDIYMPGIFIEIGQKDYAQDPINLKKVEKDFDDAMPSILSKLDYVDVIWDDSRGTRKFDDDMNIYDYTVKILLKLN